MTNESKLGLLAGVAAVLLIAVVYYQKGTTNSVEAPKVESGRSILTPPPASTPTDPLFR